MSTQNIPFFFCKLKKKKKKEKKTTLNYPKSESMGFFQGTQEPVRKSRGKRVISVRATEGLL